MLSSFVRTSLIFVVLNASITYLVSAKPGSFGPVPREPGKDIAEKDQVVETLESLPSLLETIETAIDDEILHELEPSDESVLPGSLFDKIGTFHWVGVKAFAQPQGLFDYQGMLAQSSNRVTCICGFLAWAFFLTWMLVTTAEHFFCPPLMYWTRKLKLQPEVAGATLLAFGNGAPDVFTAQAAVKAKDIPLLLGEMLGANAFLLCVVMGSLILVSQGKSSAVPAKSRFLYTIVWYILAILANFVIISDGTVTVPESLFLLSSYGVYVVSLIFWNARHPNRIDCKVPKQENDPRFRYGAAGQPDFTHGPPQPPSPPEPVLGPNGEVIGDDWDTGHVVPHIEAPPIVGISPPWSGSPMDWLIFGITWPFWLIRWVTIPPSDDYWDSTRRTLCALSPLGVVGLCYLVFGSINDIITWGCVGAGACFLGMVFYCVTDDGPEVPPLYPVFTLLAKVSSCIWLAFLAAELTNVVKALGVGIGVPTALLGITVVAWGNSFGDLLSGMSVTRSGDGRLAIIAVFSSPLFSNLIGFGLSSWMAAKAAGGRAIIWEASDANMKIIVLMPLFAGLVCVMIAAVIVWLAFHVEGYRSVPKTYWAIGLFALYGIFIGMEVLDIVSPIGSDRHRVLQ